MLGKKTLEHEIGFLTIEKLSLYFLLFQNLVYFCKMMCIYREIQKVAVWVLLLAVGGKQTVLKMLLLFCLVCYFVFSAG